jgi:hypothetical protein
MRQQHFSYVMLLSLEFCPVACPVLSEIGCIIVSVRVSNRTESMYENFIQEWGLPSK